MIKSNLNRIYRISYIQPKDLLKILLLINSIQNNCNIV